jgi:pectinesterase
MAVPGYSCTLADADSYTPPQGTVSRTVLETVGKMVVMHSSIGRHIERTHPWADWNQSGKLSYRPVQLDTDDFWAHLRAIGIDPVKTWGYAPQPQPAEPFLAEFENTDE